MDHEFKSRIQVTIIFAVISQNKIQNLKKYWGSVFFMKFGLIPKNNNYIGVQKKYVRGLYLFKKVKILAYFDFYVERFIMYEKSMIKSKKILFTIIEWFNVILRWCREACIVNQLLARTIFLICVFQNMPFLLFLRRLCVKFIEQGFAFWIVKGIEFLPLVTRAPKNMYFLFLKQSKNTQK